MKNSEALKSKIIEYIREGQSTGELRTIRSLGVKFKFTQCRMLEMIEDMGLNINTGVGTNLGTYTHRYIGDYTVEDLDFDPYKPEELSSGRPSDFVVRRIED